MKQKVILDCDNTMGVKRSDIDDGLTFAYLYTHDEVDLLGMTITFANNHEHVCYYNTKQMMEDMGITDVPYFAGGRIAGAYESPAVDFLVEQVNKYPGEITIIAIGAQTNLAGAYAKDADFFKKAKRLILMGGMIEPLYLNGKFCKELNFTVDGKAAGEVIFNADKISVMSSQCTRDAEYPQSEIDKVRAIDSAYTRYIMPMIEAWVAHQGPAYGGNNSFINWDLCCAIYLTNPELFQPKECRVVKDFEAMKTGDIIIDNENKYSDEEVNIVDIPTKILDIETFNNLFYKELAKMKI